CVCASGCDAHHHCGTHAQPTHTSVLGDDVLTLVWLPGTCTAVPAPPAPNVEAPPIAPPETSASSCSVSSCSLRSRTRIIRIVARTSFLRTAGPIRACGAARGHSLKVGVNDDVHYAANPSRNNVEFLGAQLGLIGQLVFFRHVMVLRFIQSW